MTNTTTDVDHLDATICQNCAGPRDHLKPGTYCSKCDDSIELRDRQFAGDITIGVWTTDDVAHLLTHLCESMVPSTLLEALVAKTPGATVKALKRGRPNAILTEPFGWRIDVSPKCVRALTPSASYRKWQWSEIAQLIRDHESPDRRTAAADAGAQMVKATAKTKAAAADAWLAAWTAYTVPVPGRADVVEIPDTADSTGEPWAAELAGDAEQMAGVSPTTLAAFASGVLSLDTLEHLPLEQLVPHPDNPRGPIDTDDEMVESMKAQGILQPLLVTPIPDTADRWWLIAGHRRHHHATLAGLTTAPCVIRSMDEAAALMAMLTENSHRLDLDPLDEARAYQRLVRDFGVKQDDVSKRVGRSPGHISKRLSLLKLPDVVQARIRKGSMGVDAALQLVPLAAHPDRLRKCVDGNGNVTSWKVDEALRDVKRDKAAAKLVDELEAAGVAVVDWPDPGSWEDRTEKPLAGQDGIPHWIWTVGVDVETHQSEPCHGAAVWPKLVDAAVVFVCLDPARHQQPAGDPDDPDAPTQADDASPVRARRDGLALLRADHERVALLDRALEAEASKRQLDVARAMVAKASAAEAVPFLVHLLLEDDFLVGDEDGIMLLLGLLGVADPAGDEDAENPGDIEAQWDARLEALHTYVDKSAANAMRAAMATAFVAANLQRSWGVSPRMLGALAGAGYEPTPAELEALEPTADTPKHPAGTCRDCGGELGDDSWNSMCGLHVQRCRLCGCTRQNVCGDRCAWYHDDLCTSCVAERPIDDITVGDDVWQDSDKPLDGGWGDWWTVATVAADTWAGEKAVRLEFARPKGQRADRALTKVCGTDLIVARRGAGPVHHPDVDVEVVDPEAAAGGESLLDALDDLVAWLTSLADVEEVG